MPGTGFLTLGAAGALAFCRVVREEYPDVPCKLNEVSAPWPGWRGTHSSPCPLSRAWRGMERSPARPGPPLTWC